MIRLQALAGSISDRFLPMADPRSPSAIRPRRTPLVAGLEESKRTTEGGAMNRYTWILSLVALGVGESSSIAAPPDFSICAGQAGVALGLCNGGVAAGCASSDGGTEACLNIEDQYRKLTGGQEAPWIIVQYPIHAIAMHFGVGLDLETGVMSISSGLAVDSSDFPSCSTVSNCRAIDLTAYVVDEPNQQVGDPFQFLQGTCTDPTESGYGGVPQYALLEGVQFSNVGQASIDTATFQEAPLYALNYGLVPAFGASDTVIVRTCAGNYFKVGNATCNYPEPEWPACTDVSLPEYWAGYDYQMLRSAQ